MTHLERAIRSQPVQLGRLAERHFRATRRTARLAALECVRSVVESTVVPAIQPPDRALVLAGVGAGALSAREGALKLREAAEGAAGADGE
jgi:hypothetical protein